VWTPESERKSISACWHGNFVVGMDIHANILSGTGYTGGDIDAPIATA
jgi:hypothetical protein